MLSTGSEQQGQNIRVRTVFLILTEILDLHVFFHQVCKNNSACVFIKAYAVGAHKVASKEHAQRFILEMTGHTVRLSILTYLSFTVRLHYGNFFVMTWYFP